MSNMLLSMTVKGRDRASDIFRKVGRNVSDTNKASNRLARGFGALGSRMNIFKRNTKQARNELSQFTRQASQAERGMSRLKKAAIGIFAGGMLAMGGSMAMGKLGGLASTVANYEAAIDKVAAVANVKKGSLDYSLLDSQAKELGANTSFSASEAAQGQQYLAMAGFNTKENIAAMPGMLDLAKAGDTDLATTADIGSNILSGFGMEASKMGKLGDVLTATFTTSNTNLAMLGDTMKYVAPMASKAGASIEQTAAMVGLLGNVGIQGSNAGTALRSMFNRLAGPPKMAADALNSLNIKTKGAAGNMRLMPDILKDVYDKTKDLGSGDQLAIFKKIAGNEAGAAFAELVKQAGEGNLQTYIGELESSAGRAGQVAKQMADNLKGDLTALGSIKEGVQITLGELFMGDMRGAVQSVTQMLKDLNRWVKMNPRLAKTIGMVGVALTGVAVTLGAMTLFGPMLMAAFNPVMLPILAIAGGAAIIAANWENLDSDIKSTLQGVIRILKFFAGDVISFGKALFSGDWAGVKQGFANLKFDLKRLAHYVWEGVQWAAPKIDNMFNLPEGATLATIQATWQPISDFFTGFWGGLSSTFEPVSKSFSSMWESLGGVREAFSELFSTIFHAAEGEISIATKLGDMFGTLAGGGLMLFADTVKTAAIAVTLLMNGLDGLIKNGKNAFNWMTGQTRFKEWESAHQMATAEIQAHVDALRDLTGSRESALAAINKMTEAERKAAEVKVTAGLTLAEDERGSIYKEMHRNDGWIMGSKFSRTGEMREFQAALQNEQATSTQILDFLNKYKERGHHAIVNNDGSLTKNAERFYAYAEALAANEQQIAKLETAQQHLITAAEQMKTATATNVNQATAIVANENWQDEGYKVMATFALGISSGASLAIAEVQKTTAAMDAMLPHSDAKTGPLSRLTASGAALMPTFAEGIRQTAKQPIEVMRPFLEEARNEFEVVKKPKKGGYSDEDNPQDLDNGGLSHANKSEARPQKVEQHFTISITVNEAEADAREIGRMVAEQIAEQARTATSDGGTL